MSQHFAVVGNPIAHSLSPIIHQQFAAQHHIELIYDKIKGDDLHFEQQVKDFFVNGGRGLNITLPFKQRAFALAQLHSERCNMAGAANTLRLAEGQLVADNTDGVGLICDLNRYLKLEQKRILILGAGGAARGIIHTLLGETPASITVANRSDEKKAQFTRDFPMIKWCRLEHIGNGYDLIINATSATLTQQQLLLPAQLIDANPFCYDLSYQLHSDTAFVDWAQALGGRAVDGLGMLVEQAAEAFFLWHGVRPVTTELIKRLRLQVPQA